MLTDQYLRTPVHTPDEERKYTELAMRLIDETDIATRAAVSVRLAPHACAPRSIMLQLARDVLEVAEPVLLQSPVLTPADCEAIIEERGVSYADILARRPKPAPAPIPTPEPVPEPAKAAAPVVVQAPEPSRCAVRPEAVPIAPPLRQSIRRLSQRSKTARKTKPSHKKPRSAKLTPPKKPARASCANCSSPPAVPSAGSS